MRIATVAAAALVLAACGGAGAKSTTWQHRGVSVRIPPGWHATSARLTPVTWPVQFIAVASYPLPSGDGGADGCEPKAAVDRLPPDGAFIFGWEYVGAPPSGVFPPRPRRFRLVNLGNYECLQHSYLLRFREAGRYFQVHVLLGRRAGETTRALALRVLDSLAVRRR
ncbi:MAG TPA: hypothetical protein VKR79_04760 [Gaiellaceae bacterium]|nr:hypothetical protein [Gaiellaceae bacterium]